MNKAHKIWLETVKIESKPTTIYTATYENKEVRVHSVGSRIFINWFIDNELVKAIFPKEIEKEIIDYIKGLYCKYISKDLLNDIVNKMSECLPYLEDDEDTVRNIILNVEVSR